MRSQKRSEGIQSRCIALNGQEVGDCCCGFHFIGDLVDVEIVVTIC